GDLRLPPELLGKITESMAQLYRVVPIQFEGNALTVATCDPQNITIQDELRSLLGYEIELVIATEEDIQRVIDKYYDAEKESMDSVIKEYENDKELKQQMSALDTGGAINLSDMESLADSAPVRKLLNMVLL